MSVAAALYATLDADTEIANYVADRISPYMRNREDDFPAVLYSVPREEMVEPDAAVHRLAEIEVACIARNLADADDCAEAVVAALPDLTNATAACIDSVRITSIERDVLDAYDGGVALLYRSTVRAVAHHNSGG